MEQFKTWNVVTQHWLMKAMTKSRAEDYLAKQLEKNPDYPAMIYEGWDYFDGEELFVINNHEDYPDD